MGHIVSFHLFLMERAINDDMEEETKRIRKERKKRGRGRRGNLR